MGATPTPFSYEFPLENSMKISIKNYNEEANTNNNSNHYNSHEGCSID